MNREKYKSIRHKPKQNRAMTRAKSQMLAKPKESSPIDTAKLRQIYSNKTEWATKIMPKLKE